MLFDQKRLEKVTEEVNGSPQMDTGVARDCLEREEEYRNQGDRQITEIKITVSEKSADHKEKLAYTLTMNAPSLSSILREGAQEEIDEMALLSHSSAYVNDYYSADYAYFVCVYSLLMSRLNALRELCLYDNSVEAASWAIELGMRE